MAHRICLALFLLLPASTQAQTPTLVDVGGHRLDVLQVGAGPQTVVLEGGLANPLDSWKKVWPDLATFTTVVAYSRAGVGRSDPLLGPHTARMAVEDLHHLLLALHRSPPFVLVGKSYGGILVRLYTSLYPKEVVGLVLVDGTHEQQVQRWGQLDSTYPAAFRAYFDSLLPAKAGADAAELRESIGIQAAGRVPGMLPLPDIPLAVITSMQASAHPNYINQTVAGHQVWRALHDEWFQRSTNAIHLVTTQSSHAVEDEQPGLIVQAVRFVLDRLHH